MDFEINRWTSFDCELVFMQDDLRSASVNGASETVGQRKRAAHRSALVFIGSHALSLSQAALYLDAISGFQKRILGFAFLNPAEVVQIRRQEPAGVSARNPDAGLTATRNPAS
jgi:hypothetical protein